MSSQFGLSGAHVLVVEDDQLLASTLALVLEQAGATVAGPCASYRTAMASIVQRMPNMALLDVNILDGTSFELAEWLGQHHVPFAFITGEPLDQIPFRLGHMGYLRKPASRMDVHALAERLWAAAQC